MISLSSVLYQWITSIYVAVQTLFTYSGQQLMVAQSLNCSPPLNYNEIIRDYQETYRNSNGENLSWRPFSDGDFLYYLADLNDDGNMEVFIRTTRESCGASGMCSHSILEFYNGEWRTIGGALVAGGSYSILEDKTNGYRNLSLSGLSVRGQTWTAYTTVFEFNGNAYESAQTWRR